MLKKLADAEMRRTIITYSISGIIVVGFFFVIANLQMLYGWLIKALDILAPFIWGLFMVFLLTPIADRIERLMPDGFWGKRAISTLVSILIVIAIIAAFVAVLIPQLVTSFATLSVVIKSFLANTSQWSEPFVENLHLSEELVNKITSLALSLISNIWNLANESLPTIVKATTNAISGVMDFVIGLIICAYIQLDREHLVKTASKVVQVMVSSHAYERIDKVFHLSLDKFRQFFFGKIIDSLIIAIICYFAMTILRMDYILLISFIIGLTNIIPFFGPFIGAVPSCLILLIVDPFDALIFLIMIIILQQIDGQLIGPYILGESVGLSSIWILFAITVGSGLFGIPGMILGVPVFAVIFFLVREVVNVKYENRKKEGTIKDKPIS